MSNLKEIRVQKQFGLHLKNRLRKKEQCTSRSILTSKKITVGLPSSVIIFPRAKKGLGKKTTIKRWISYEKFFNPKIFINHSFLLEYSLLSYFWWEGNGVYNTVLNRCARVVIVTMLWLYNLNGFMLHFQSPFTTYHNKMLCTLRKYYILVTKWDSRII